MCAATPALATLSVRFKHLDAVNDLLRIVGVLPDHFVFGTATNVLNESVRARVLLAVTDHANHQVESRQLESRVSDISEVDKEFYMSDAARCLYARGQTKPLAGVTCNRHAKQR